MGEFFADGQSCLDDDAVYRSVPVLVNSACQRGLLQRTDMPRDGQ